MNEVTETELNKLKKEDLLVKVADLNKSDEINIEATDKNTKPEIIALILKTLTPAPNVVFVGRRKVMNQETGKPELVNKDVPESISTPAGIINLPEVKHGESFYHESADVLISQPNQDFKRPTAKGDK